jgi:hypothetical protein
MMHVPSKFQLYVLKEHGLSGEVPRVLDAIEAFIPESGEIRLAAAFNQIDLDLRREVELAGLMRFALLAGGAVETGPRATYLCRDIEGCIRAWSAPDMIVVRTSVETLKGEFNV